MLRQHSSVAILGAGHGGLALAGYLAQNGHQVTLWNRSPGPITPVAERGGIHLSSGPAPAFVPIAKATCHMAVALAGARKILVAVPACAHADVARKCSPYLRDGQTVLLLPGRTGGALEFRRVLQDEGCRARVLLGEANTFPMASRCVGPAAAVIFGTKDEVLAASLPAARTRDLMAEWRPLLPMLRPARSVLQTGLANLGAILHPVITLLNAERIRRGDSFDFYTEGVTPGVAAVLAAADEERLRIAGAYGVPACSLQEWIASAYDHHAGSVLEAVGANPAYRGIKAPTTLVHRYLLEDVPTGLIPQIELARAAGLATPTLRGLVERARAVLGEERWCRSRTLAALGLAGLSPEAVQRVIEQGPVAKPTRTVAASPFVRVATGFEMIGQN